MNALARVEYREVAGVWSTPRGRRASFTYREGTNDWNTISACLGTNDEYGLASEEITGRAVDIGGYLGSVGVTIAIDNPQATVTIIEPVPWNADLIRRNAAANDVSDRVTVIEGAAGIGGEDVSVWFGYRGNETAEHHAFVGNSTLAYDNGGELDHDERKYKALGLSDLLADGPIDFLKIDCEGGEWAFLDTPLTAQIPVIVGEAHSVRGHKGKDIVALLPEHDVTLSGDPETTCGFRAVIRA